MHSEPQRQTAAKLKRLAEVYRDGSDLRATDKSNRPGSATIDAVRRAERDASKEIMDSETSDPENVALPTERLGGGS